MKQASPSKTSAANIRVPRKTDRADLPSPKLNPRPADAGTEPALTHDRDRPEDRVVAGKRIVDWAWEHVPNGFNELQSDIRREVGLFAAKKGESFAYIGSAVQPHAGFRAGLARVRLKLQSGNSSPGIKAVKAAGNSVEAYVIRMTGVATLQEIYDLKWALIDLHKPSNNAARDIVRAAREAAYVQRSK